MKRALPLFLGSLFAASCALAADWRKIPIPPLSEFRVQQPKRIDLGNGMVVFLQEDHELPIVRGTARIRGGSREEPAQKVSLVSLYGQAWRTGGTRSKTGDALDDFLEARAAKVETSGGLDSTTISWNCLKESLDEVFPVFVDLLAEPEFRQEKIDLGKRQIETSISRRNDNSGPIASREAGKLGYGVSCPYARVPEYATVAAITREDLLAWHREHVHPNNILLSVAGDFDSASMERRLRDAFESWPKGRAAARGDDAISEAAPGIFFIARDDVDQSEIRMVHLGSRKDNPDYYALEVANEILGGGFSSRLFSNIRSRKGLAYAVWGQVGTAFDHPGLLSIGMGTKSGTTAAAIEALLLEIGAFQKNPSTPEELARAKDNLLNSFIFRFDSKEKVLAEKMSYAFYGYPADFLERYRAGIERVTADDVARAAREYIHRDRLAILVVGKAADFEKPLSTFGKVQEIDIAIPEAPGEKAGK